MCSPVGLDVVQVHFAADLAELSVLLQHEVTLLHTLLKRNRVLDGCLQTTDICTQLLLVIMSFY